MSQGDDKIKSDNNSVVNAVLTPENDSAMNKTNTDETVNAANLVTPSIFNDQAINFKSEELMPNIREDMVSKATEFLMDASIQLTPKDRKVNFLRSKGLTDQEITVSLQRAATRCNQNSYTHNATPFPSPVYYNSSNTTGIVQTPFETQKWYTRLFGPIAFAATVTYIAYQIYKKYVENWLFGVRKPSVENRLEAVELSMQRVLMLLEDKKNSSETSFNAHSDRQIEHDQLLRSELKIIKSLLLNKSQFPPAPVASSIPQWQLPKNAKQQVEQQNKVSGTNTPNKENQKQVNGINIPSTSKQNIVKGILIPSTLPQSILNDLNNTSIYDLETSVINTDKIIDETYTSNDSSIGKAKPMVPDQSVIERGDVVAKSDEIKHSINSVNSTNSEHLNR